jgi:hypothetical protein
MLSIREKIQMRLISIIPIIDMIDMMNYHGLNSIELTSIRQFQLNNM